LWFGEDVTGGGQGKGNGGATEDNRYGKKHRGDGGPGSRGDKS